MTADAMGRPPLPAVVPPHVTALLEAAHREQVAAAAPVPLMLGRHLIELGLTPGPAIGALLERVYEAQLDGAFVDLAGARAWLLAHDDGRLDGAARQRLADRVAAGG
jgi:tRNA nucleotidyltransferase (CCA-adding enzyme)